MQFTPDLLPSDVLGSSVWNQGDGTFEFRPGPVFTQLLLGDEINRASPKTQSALLEAMAEEQVTVDGATYPLHRPFMVIATQNPLEHHGTFPLPESQLDRFLMKLSIGYPGRADELALLREEDHDRALERPARPSRPPRTCVAMGRRSTGVHVADALAAYLVDLADRSRRSPLLSLGISPRASLGLLPRRRVWAAADGRSFVTPDDIKDLAVPVLAHRVVVGTDGRLGGVTAEETITRAAAGHAGALLRWDPDPHRRARRPGQPWALRCWPGCSALPEVATLAAAGLVLRRASRWRGCASAAPTCASHGSPDRRASRWASPARSGW